MSEQKINELKEEFENLVSVTITSIDDLMNFLNQQKSVYEKVEEEMLRHYIAFQCQSNNDEIKQQFEFDQQHIKPMLKKYQSILDEKVLESPYMAELQDDVFGEYKKKLRTQFALFQEANLEIEKQEDALTNQYFEVTGSLSSNWEGKEVTISELFVHIRDSKRDIREKAMKALYEPILKEEEKLQSILDELIQLRVKKAANAGLDGFNDICSKNIIDLTIRQRIVRNSLNPYENMFFRSPYNFKKSIKLKSELMFISHGMFKRKQSVENLYDR